MEIPPRPTAPAERLTPAVDPATEEAAWLPRGVLLFLVKMFPQGGTR